MHQSITRERVMSALKSKDYPGFCLTCGAEAEGCEPDAEYHECDSCGAPSVFGAEQVLLKLALSGRKRPF